MANLMKVAAAQFSTGTDVAANLDTTLRMIARAADEGAELVVTPEFCNHLSVYDSGDHAWDVAIEVDGEWPKRIGELAAERGIWVQFNATVRRTPGEAGQRPVISNSNFVVDPTGRVALVADKTVLMGAEGEYLTAAAHPSSQIHAEFATIGSYACMDGIVPEVPRSVAAGGARILLNSLNSFALDEASVHIPVRAAENRAWVIACCKVGPLLPPDKVSAFSEMMGVPADMLSGAGESQIVAPDGTVVAIGPREGEAVVAAEIDLDRCGQPRPDGTDVWASRRPGLYAPLGEPTPPSDDHARAEEITAAVVHTVDRIPEALASGADLVVLPELALDGMPPESISAILEGSRAIVVSSFRDGNAHVGIAVDSTGVIAEQPQLHHVGRLDWVEDLGGSLRPFDLPWGRLAILCGDDLIYPEVARLAALDSVDVLAVPLNSSEAWETELGVVERAAENRMCVVAADSIGSAGRSTIADLPPDFTLWAQSRERPFDGTINHPDLRRTTPAADAVLVAAIHPARSVHRQISKGTNLVDGRPWQHAAAILT